MEKLNYSLVTEGGDRDPNCLNRKTCIATEAAAEKDWLLLPFLHEVEHSSSIATKCTFFTWILYEIHIVFSFFHVGW